MACQGRRSIIIFIENYPRYYDVLNVLGTRYSNFLFFIEIINLQ